MSDTSTDTTMSTSIVTLTTSRRTIEQVSVRQRRSWFFRVLLAPFADMDERVVHKKMMLRREKGKA
jgi:hypothetical protein